MISIIARVLGINTVAVGKALYVLGCIAAALVSGALIHSYDRAQHDKVVADLRADAATKLAEATAKALITERRQAAELDELETSYGRMAEDREKLRAEGARLSGDLRAAVERLLRTGERGSGGGGAVPRTTDDALRCADLSAARDRAIGALELLQAAGDRAAADGQHAVDVATTAAQAARDQDAEPGHE